MIELIFVMALILFLGFIFLMLASIFIAYITQANYVDENYEGDEKDD
jgi:hypothetical protein